ncbi:MAG TPA: FAD-dependent thymidylate synthase [Alphaproteobacteria bacterium]|nr:FAD-dependent thymidylate synthase [Alphaproteobacteria bacterium]|tara:strand:- start:2155 stop:3093 length:939 start_codon:yes stop_codon:yes gene_type:complete
MVSSKRKKQAPKIQNVVQRKTKRATVLALEKILYKPIKLLDHGFIRVIDYMGDDSAIVQAARVSYGSGTKKVSQDKGLIHYLMRHRHSTPFEMCEIKFHVKLPIFVARQWIRHRTANVNEYSARYSILDREFYIPEAQQLSSQSSVNNQGRDEVLGAREAKRVLELLRKDASDCYEHYEEMLNFNEQGKILDENKKGLTRELARMNLTLNTYTQWYWKIDLHNLMHFISLRLDQHAQYEIRVYAQVMLDCLKKWTPITYEAFCQHRLGAIVVSQSGKEIIKKLIKGKKVSQASSGISQREWIELMDSLGLKK